MIAGHGEHRAVVEVHLHLGLMRADKEEVVHSGREAPDHGDQAEDLEDRLELSLLPLLLPTPWRLCPSQTPCVPQTGLEVIESETDAAALFASGQNRKTCLAKFSGDKDMSRPSVDRQLSEGLRAHLRCARLSQSDKFLA